MQYKSSHARYAAHTARALGYAFIAHDPDGYLFEIRDGARRAFFSCAAGSPYALNPAHGHAIARDKAFTNAVLEEAGLQTIPSRLFFTSSEHAALRSPGREPVDAMIFAAQAAFPLFVKPVDGARGAFAESVADSQAFERYLARVAAKHYAILVQPVIQAPELRVLVLKGAPLFWYRKTPAIAGGAANRAAGGRAASLSTDVPNALAALAAASADALQLQLAAVDIFETESGPVVIEVNSNPAIETLEDHDRWDLIETIWRANFEAALR